MRNFELCMKQFKAQFETYSKLRPVVAGYKMDKRNFFLSSITKTARQVSGIPSVLSSSLSNILNFRANSRLLSAIIG